MNCRGFFGAGLEAWGLAPRRLGSGIFATLISPQRQRYGGVEMGPPSSRRRGGALPRLVAVGDLNGSDEALVDILRGTGLIDRHAHWKGGRSELVQLGDLFNRGRSARAAMNRLLSLQREAARAGGKVTVLLGNHEAMVALRHEAYCTEHEYLSFATPRERRVWPGRVRRAMRRLLRDHPKRGPILPIEPRLEAWKVLNVPGREALRRAVGPRGRIGRAIRRLPVAYQAGDVVFVHAGLLPNWAELGVEGLNKRARDDWKKAKRFIRNLPRESMFIATDGPLWDRQLAYGEPGAASALRRSLRTLGVARMVIGHTQTGSVRGGSAGTIHLRFGGRLVLADVGLGDEAPRAALVITAGTGTEWTPDGCRTLWDAAPR